MTKLNHPTQQAATLPEVMQRFLLTFLVFCLAASLLIFDNTAEQYFAQAGIFILLPSFIYGMYIYLKLLKLRLGTNRRNDDPFAEEADPNDIAKQLAAKKKKVTNSSE